MEVTNAKVNREIAEVSLTETQVAEIKAGQAVIERIIAAICIVLSKKMSIGQIRTMLPDFRSELTRAMHR